MSNKEEHISRSILQGKCCCVYKELKNYCCITTNSFTDSCTDPTVNRNIFWYGVFTVMYAKNIII